MVGSIHLVLQPSPASVSITLRLVKPKPIASKQLLAVLPLPALAPVSALCFSVTLRTPGDHVSGVVALFAFSDGSFHLVSCPQGSSMP